MDYSSDDSLVVTSLRPTGSVTSAPTTVVSVEASPKLIPASTIATVASGDNLSRKLIGSLKLRPGSFNQTCRLNQRYSIESSNLLTLFCIVDTTPRVEVSTPSNSRGPRVQTATTSRPTPQSEASRSPPTGNYFQPRVADTDQQLPVVVSNIK